MKKRIVAMCLASAFILAMFPQIIFDCFAATSDNLTYEMREEVIEFKLSDGTLYYSNTIYYPYFLGNSVAEIVINSRYAAIIAEFENSTTDFDALYQEALEWSPDGVDGLPFYDDITAEVSYCNNGVISIKECSTMWSGGMHPYSDYRGYTYLVDDGSKLSLNDVLMTSEKEIKNLIEQYKQGIVDYYDAEVIMESPFVLTDDGLCFLCNVGDSVPPEEIIIPYTASDAFIIFGGDDSKGNEEYKEIRETGYVGAMQKAIEDTKSYSWGTGYGALYDIDGNGIEELIMVYTIKAVSDQGYEFPAKVCSVYTMSNREIIPLIERKELYQEAGSPWGYVGVVKKDHQTYLAVNSSNGGWFGSVQESYGNWDLYTLDGTSLVQEMELEYTCVTEDDSLLYEESSVTIDDQTYSYSVYEEWVNGIEVLYAVYPEEVSWAPQYEKTMTLEDLLEYLKENPVEDSFIPADNSTFEDYARTEWIEQHMEYAASDEYGDEIVAGFSGSLNDWFTEIRDDNTIKAYSTLDSVNQILSFDLDLSETQEYELLLAQIFFSYVGEAAIEEIYAENMTKAVIMIGEEVLNLDDFKQIGDSDQLKGILNALKSAKGVEEMNTACDSFFNFVDGYDNLNIKKHLADNIGKESFNLAWDVAIDSLDLVTTTLKELTMYIAVGEAYAQTSDAFGEVLLAMRRNIGLSADNPKFNPIGTQNLVTDDVIWNLIGTNDSAYPDPLNTPVVLKDLATAIEDFYTSIETYKNEDSTYIAQVAIADLQDGAVNDILINNSANAAVSLFSCLPVIREYKIIKDILATGQALIDLMTSVDDQEYLGTMLLRLYCISYLQYLTVDSIAGTPESWNMASIDLDNATSGTIIKTTETQDLYESQFSRATRFDAAVNVYKSISAVAADYAMEYVDLFLADAISDLEAYDKGGFFDQFLKNRDDLVQTVTQYKDSIKMLESQKAEIQTIACHDADLQYNSETDEITYNFKDSRIYVVACPVDVIVTTDTGEQIAYLSGEENQIASGYEFYFRTIKLTDDSDEYIKVAVVPDEYQIELKGTGDGVMHAFVADFTTGDVGEVETYFNIPIEKDSVGYFEASFDDTNGSSLVMDQVLYSNMESVEDIPTDSGENNNWIWIAGSGTVVGLVILIILIRCKKSK